MNFDIIDQSVENDLNNLEGKPLKYLFELLYCLENTVGIILEDKKSSDLHYNHIGSSYGELFKQLKLADEILNQLNIQTRKFVDAGCGIGTKVAFAKKLGWEVTGLEVNKDYIEITKKLNFIGICPEIVNCDICEYDHYEDFDVIFFFDPIKNREKYDLFIKKICYESRIPSIIIQPTVWHWANLRYRHSLEKLSDFPKKVNFYEMEKGITLKCNSTDYKKLNKIIQSH